MKMLWMKMFTVRRKSKQTPWSFLCEKNFVLWKTLIWFSFIYIGTKQSNKYQTQPCYILKGEEFGKVIDNVYHGIITRGKKLFKLPSRKAPKWFIKELTVWLEDKRSLLESRGANEIITGRPLSSSCFKEASDKLYFKNIS